MAKKAKKSKKDNKNLIIGICSAVVVLVVIIVAVVLATSGSSRLDDGYFVSDESKYVISYDIDQDEAEGESSEDMNAPLKIHEVYTYEGETITSVKEYYEYAGADAAKAAYDEMMANMDEEESIEIALDGKYIVITIPAEQYENLTASDVKSQLEFIETLKNTSSESTDGDAAEVLESDETVEVEE